MAVYRVGDRVRIIRAVMNPSLIGKQATIVYVDSDDRPYKLHVDGYGPDHPSHICRCPGMWCDSTWIEPLQPERNQIVAWAECEWMPEHLRVQA